MAYEEILYDVSDRIATVTLNRPTRLNAWTMKMEQEVEHAMLAAAAVGQIRLARAYEEVLAPHGLTTAQILVTLEDTEDRRRYLNSRATMETLLGLGVVPVVEGNPG